MIVLRYLLSILPFWLLVAAIFIGWNYHQEITAWLKGPVFAYASSEPAEVASAEQQPGEHQAYAPEEESVEEPEPQAPVASDVPDMPALHAQNSAPVPMTQPRVTFEPMPREMPPAMAYTAAPESQLEVLSEEHRLALMAARKAFWSRDAEAALAQYEALAEALPNNADIIGEWGNVYWALGDQAAAAQQYVRVAELLMGTPRSMLVWRLLPIIGQQLPNEAHALREQLMG